jgi:hypothetical protein
MGSFSLRATIPSVACVATRGLRSPSAGQISLPRKSPSHPRELFPSASLSPLVSVIVASGRLLQCEARVNRDSFLRHSHSPSAVRIYSGVFDEPEATVLFTSLE